MPEDANKLSEADRAGLITAFSTTNRRGVGAAPKELFYKVTGIDPVAAAIKVDERIRAADEGRKPTI